MLPPVAVRRSIRRLALSLACLALLGAPGAGQADAGVADDGADAAQGEQPVEPDSPRVALTQYLQACREQRFEQAARFLDLPEARRGEGAALARQLKAVLDRHVWIDLESISPESLGDADDDLSPATDEVGRIPVEEGGSEPVRMTRAASPPPHWVFSRATVERIPSWYGDLEHRWAIELLPPALLQPGPADLLWWQWIALGLLAVLAWLVGMLLARITAGLLNRLASRTDATWDDVILARLDGPIALAWSLAVAYALVPLLGLYEPAQDFVHRLLRAGLFLVFFWSMLRAIDVLANYMLQTAWASSRPASRSLIPLGGRVLKVAVLAMAAVAVLADFGFPIASLIAGLSVGGLALALAAQKTVENLFGAFSIGVDQPFRVGDFVKVDEITGTVEVIGMRSTRIRTLDRTLVTLPNGRLADMRIESFSARDRFRLAITIGVTYGTSAAQIRQVLERTEALLRGHAQIWPDTVIVRFSGFGASSLDIEVVCWFLVPDFNAFRDARQEVLLGIMDIVESAGTSFAFPTQTLHLVQETATAARRD